MATRVGMLAPILAAALLTAGCSAAAVVEPEDGGFLVAGFVQLVNGRSYDAILLRTNAEGRVGE